MRNSGQERQDTPGISLSSRDQISKPRGCETLLSLATHPRTRSWSIMQSAISAGYRRPSEGKKGPLPWMIAGFVWFEVTKALCFLAANRCRRSSAIWTGNVCLNWTWSHLQCEREVYSLLSQHYLMWVSFSISTSRLPYSLVTRTVQQKALFRSWSWRKELFHQTQNLLTVGSYGVQSSVHKQLPSSDHIYPS